MYAGGARKSIPWVVDIGALGIGEVAGSWSSTRLPSAVIVASSIVDTCRTLLLLMMLVVVVVLLVVLILWFLCGARCSLSRHLLTRRCLADMQHAMLPTKAIDRSADATELHFVFLPLVSVSVSSTASKDRNQIRWIYNTILV